MGHGLDHVKLVQTDTVSTMTISAASGLLTLRALTGLLTTFRTSLTSSLTNQVKDSIDGDRLSVALALG